MKRINKSQSSLFIVLTLVLTACTNEAVQQKAVGDLATQLKKDFSAKGPATIERLTQRDAAQKKCSEYPLEFTDEERSTFKTEQLKTVQYPEDSEFLGDWKEGKKIALNSKGMQYSDEVDGMNGGNCFACHQITKTEIAFGNLGPSLYQYRQTKGSNQKVIKYTWEKIYNAQAHRECSKMPRFGYAGILTEQQLKDVMAFLFDPKSPVNL